MKKKTKTWKIKEGKEKKCEVEEEDEEEEVYEEE